MRVVGVVLVVAPSLALGQPAPNMSPPGMVQPPPPDLMAYHRGVTFEANLGLGYVRISDSGQSVDSDFALAGVDLGVGGWLTPQLALTGRVVGVQVKSSTATNNGTTENVFVGPSLQYWLDPHFWFGGGLGFATYRVFGTNSCSGSDCGVNGFGLDLRAGYTFGSSQHTFNVSVELDPGFYSQTDPNGVSVSATATSVAFLAGYQYL